MAMENKDDIIIAMLEEMKSGMKNQKQTQLDLSEVKLLSDKLENAIGTTSDCVIRMGEIIEVTHKPAIRECKITLDIVSKEVAFLFVGMGLVISVLGSALYFSTGPNYDHIDNDLKYRYIKMKGEATPERLSELENIFEINRDNDKIRQMEKDIEAYEQTVKAKATLDEQNRRKFLEAEQLKSKAESIKKK